MEGLPAIFLHLMDGLKLLQINIIFILMKKVLLLFLTVKIVLSGQAQNFPDSEKDGKYVNDNGAKYGW